MSESTVATTVFKAHVSPKWLRLKKPNNHGQSDERQLYLTVSKTFRASYTASAKTTVGRTSFSPFETLQMNNGIGHAIGSHRTRSLDPSATRHV